MKKRIAMAMVICLLVLSPLAAGDIEFTLDSFNTNNDIFIGFCPTFLTGGIDYTGLELIDGNSTDLIFITGGGYTQRQLWRDANGAPLINYANESACTADADARTFNVITGEWKILFTQGVFWNEATYNDLVTIELGYLGRYEKYLENKEGTTSYFIDSPNSVIYPEADQLVSNTFVGGFMIETAVNDMVSAHGFDLEFSASYAPAWILNSLLDGVVDYYSLSGVFTGYLPLYEKRSDDYMNLVSVYLSDRIRADYIEGPAVPVYAQKEPSLGYKMRGFKSFSYATSLTAVNNFDVRVSGPEVKIPGLFPRGGLYCDIGYYTGHYANDENEKDTGLLMSAGAELAFSFFDFLNLGARANYALVGDTLTKNPFSYDIFMTMHY